MKNVLLYYSFSFALGGGEYLPLAFIAALQKTSNLTVAVDQAGNFERSYKAFGTGLDIDLSRLKIVQVTPPDYDPRRHNVLASLRRFRRLRHLARSADVCISTSSIMDFGKPAHHFINMLAFGDDAFTDYVHGRSSRARGDMMTKAKRFFSNSILRPILGMRSKRSIICDRRQHIYPNSQYVEKTMKDFYGPFNSRVFYPPTLFEAEPTDVVRDPLKVVYIGRIIPDKRIEDLVAIVERARAVTGLDIAFHVAGRLDQTPSYGRKLDMMAQERNWLKFVGALYGEEKMRFLTSGTYAIHAERDEAFGISIAEYLSSGLIPIVPDEGGTPEIVDSPDLTYRTNEDAARILARLLADDGFRGIQRDHCAERAKLFSREAYLERQRKLLAEIVGVTP
jgi:glycosyltransferase involved in cell wall biosynthesis